MTQETAQLHLHPHACIYCPLDCGCEVCEDYAWQAKMESKYHVQ